MSKIKFLSLPRGTSIFKRLEIEEALLRTSSANWLILHEGSTPAIVLGISGKIDQLIDLRKLHQEPIPLIRRFSGGGTVVVDQNTLFFTLIINKQDELCHPFPRSIMEWTSQFFENGQLRGLFSLLENDYVIEDKKFGGNAQSIVKDRFLHHSSLLWDFSSKNMSYLQIPEKTPNYRKKRDHSDFLTTLNKYFPTKQSVLDQLLENISQVFHVQHVEYNEVTNASYALHRKSTTLEFVK